MVSLNRQSMSQAWCKVASRAQLAYAVGPRHVVRRTSANRRHRAVLAKRRGDVAITMWRDAAVELGASARQLAASVLEIEADSSTTRVRGQTTPYADEVSCHIASDKLLSYRLFVEAGLPVPTHCAIDDRGMANAGVIAAAGGWPLLVKPVHGRGGAGITGEIRSPSQLRRALLAAGRFDRRVLLEHQIDGDSFRILVLDDAVLDILRRGRPVVIGDGRSQLGDLILAEEERRISANDATGLKPLLTDLDCVFTLRRAGWRLRDVLPKGQTVAFKTATNATPATQTVVLSRPYPPGLVDAAVRAARAVGVRLGGVDIVTPNPHEALNATGGAVLEVNPVPALTHHYVAAGRGGDIAVPILRSLLNFDAARQSSTLSDGVNPIRSVPARS